MTIPDDLEKALESYRSDLEVSPALAAVMQAALREYLTERGYLVLAETPREKPGGTPRERRARVEGPEDGAESPWPRYPLFDSGDPTFAERAEEELAGNHDSPSFGER